MPNSSFNKYHDELFTTKRLYLFEFAVLDGLSDLSIRKVLFRIPIFLHGNHDWSQDGEWGTSTSGAGIIGVSAGWWERSDKRDWHGTFDIWLYEEKTPNAVSNLWREVPHSIGFIEGIENYPIPLGATGMGSIVKHKAPGTKSSPDYNGFRWKVTERNF